MLLLLRRESGDPYMSFGLPGVEPIREARVYANLMAGPSLWATLLGNGVRILVFYGEKSLLASTKRHLEKNYCSGGRTF